MGLWDEIITFIGLHVEYEEPEFAWDSKEDIGKKMFTFFFKDELIFHIPGIYTIFCNLQLKIKKKFLWQLSATVPCN